MTFWFEDITLRGERSGKCPCCKKRRRQATTFSHTFSPLNVNKKTGLQKSKEEITVELKKECSEWQSQPATCREVYCEEQGQWVLACQ